VDHFLSSSQQSAAPAAPDPAERRRQAVLETIEASEIALDGHHAAIVTAEEEIAGLEAELAEQLAHPSPLHGGADAHARFQVRKALASKTYALEHATEEIQNIIPQIAEYKKSLAPKK
jgi:hypothetical protein